MICTENNCGTVLNERNTFVLPLVVLATRAKKLLISMIRADLMKGAICAECAFIAHTIGEKYYSLTDALTEVKRRRAEHDAAAVAQVEARNAEVRKRFDKRQEGIKLSEQRVLQHAHRAATYRGSQNLGALLMVAGLRPSPKLADSIGR